MLHVFQIVEHACFFLNVYQRVESIRETQSVSFFSLFLLIINNYFSMRIMRIIFEYLKGLHNKNILFAHNIHQKIFSMKLLTNMVCDCSGSGNRNYLVRKQTLNLLTLAK